MTDVPLELTKGNAAQVRPLPQGVVMNFPPTHCAKASPIHPFAPFVHEELAVQLANFWLSDCASRPFSVERYVRMRKIVQEFGAYVF